MRTVQAEQEYTDLMKKRDIILKDKQKVSLAAIRFICASLCPFDRSSYDKFFCVF